ncbi:MAG: cytochrome c oxidase subunit 3 [Chitinophagaceae bacterium]|nr:cytochrome c oxidase subunit 3 [Oligoflexus sp.]
MKTSAEREGQEPDIPNDSNINLGIWIFLLTEAMLFGALILCYSVMRILHPAAFNTASHLLDWKAGTLNTAILLFSSFCMAVAVRASGKGKSKGTSVLLLVSASLGILFLAVKGMEYHSEWLKYLFPNDEFTFAGPDSAFVKLFFNAYFILTGLHAIHLTFGILWLSGLGIASWVSPQFHRRYPNAIDCAGLYWHFVDIVWVFLFPLLYLVGGS